MPPTTAPSAGPGVRHHVRGSEPPGAAPGRVEGQVGLGLCPGSDGALGDRRRLQVEHGQRACGRPPVPGAGHAGAHHPPVQRPGGEPFGQLAQAVGVVRPVETPQHLVDGGAGLAVVPAQEHVVGELQS